MSRHLLAVAEAVVEADGQRDGQQQRKHHIVDRREARHQLVHVDADLLHRLGGATVTASEAIVSGPAQLQLSADQLRSAQLSPAQLSSGRVQPGGGDPQGERERVARLLPERGGRESTSGGETADCSYSY